MPTRFRQLDRAFHAFLHYGVPETLEAMDLSVQALRAAFGVQDTSPLSCVSQTTPDDIHTVVLLPWHGGLDNYSGAI